MKIILIALFITCEDMPKEIFLCVLRNLFLRFSNNKFSSFVYSLFVYLQVLDYTQFYLDLAAANANKHEEPKWLSEYNLTTYYHGLGELSRNEISAVSLHNLADRFTNPDDILFAK